MERGGRVKKAGAWAFCVALVLSLTTMMAAADAPPPAYPNRFECHVMNAPEKAVFCDLLIQINPQSDNYTAFNDQHNTITAQAPIVLYNEDGYMSFSFHYQGVTANMGGLSGAALDSGVFFSLSDAAQSLDKISRTVKVVLLDADGNILNISGTISTAPPSAEEFVHAIMYDVTSGTTNISFSQTRNGTSSIFEFLFFIPFLMISGASYFLMVYFRMLLSIGAEVLAALPFKLRPLWKIIAVNAITQLLLILFVLFSGLPYVTAVLIGEVFVYLSEFIAYLFLFKAVSKWKIALYTVCANTLTLTMGLLMNLLHILG